MAIWHFDIGLLPELGIMRIHQCIPEEIDGYSTFSDISELREVSCDNYWAEIDVFDEFLPEARLLIADIVYQNEDEVRLGSKEGNRFTIWKDEVLFEFDVRYPDLEVLEGVLRLARKFNCKLVLGDKGTVIDPEMLLVLEFIAASGAYKFVRDPAQWAKDKKNIRSSLGMAA